MKALSILSAVALAGFMSASVVAAGDPTMKSPSPTERPFPYGDAVSPDPAGADRAGTPATGASPLEGRGSVEGTIRAIERHSGRLVLETSEGLVSLMTTPDELEGVEVGDVVRVSLLDERD
jgi:hypothetical protein